VTREVVVIKGGHTEVDISDGEQRLIDISSVSTSGVRSWMAEIDTVIDFATPR